MFKNITFRWITIVLVLSFSLFRLYPTVVFHNLSEEEKKQLSETKTQEYEELQDLAINLGLDLQGGMHVVLEVDMDTLALNLADKQSDELRSFVQKCAKISSQNESSFLDLLERVAKENSFRLIRFYHKLGTESDNESVVEELRR